MNPAEPSSTDLPATEQLLQADGDARIALDAGGFNKYGCTPGPDAEVYAFGSSTATTISPGAFAAVAHLRLQLTASSEPRAQLAMRAMERIRRELLALLELVDTELVFSASGTDAHFLAAHAVACAVNLPLTVLMVQEEETGSGVAAALSANNTRCKAVVLRLPDGSPRAMGEIDEEMTAAVKAAILQGQHVLLVMIDQSKTGLIAPGLDCVSRLQQRYPAQLTVLVDACQFRMSLWTLHRYLQMGMMVALTGSKFLAGPSFSAALLIPSRLPIHPVHAEPGLGVLFRWEAALFELRRFCAVPGVDVIRYLDAFAQAVRTRLVADPHFEPLCVPPLPDRHNNWDQVQTIFPFLLCRYIGGQRILLCREETLQIYRQLQVNLSQDRVFGDPLASLRCQFGQPVACGMREGIPVSALRLCISARQVSDAAAQQNISNLIEQAQLALDKAVWLIHKKKLLSASMIAKGAALAIIDL